MKRMRPDPNRPDLTCANGDVWPTIHAKVFNGDLLAARVEVSSLDYERMRYWSIGCGLLEMDGSGRCASCSNAIIDGKPVAIRHPRVKAAQANRKLR